MDKMTKIFIAVGVVLFLGVTFAVMFGGHSYELADAAKNIGSSKESAQGQGGNANNDEFSSYLNIMGERIQKVWTPPASPDAAEVLTEYTILKSGHIKDAKIAKSSGNADLDKSALDALAKVSPLPPLPMSFKGDSINVKFNFSYGGMK